MQAARKLAAGVHASTGSINAAAEELSRIGGELLVNTATQGAQYLQAIAPLHGGGFIAVWTDESAQGGDPNSGIKGQRFDADGNKVGAEFLVNVATRFIQRNASVAGLENGGFAVTWEDDSGQGGETGLGIVARLYDASGTPLTGDVRVNGVSSGDQVEPTITALGSGGFVVSWLDLSGIGGDVSNYGIKARIFDSMGMALGGEFLVNTTTVGQQAFQSLAALPTGGFVAAWADESRTGEDGDRSAIRAQIFDANGAKVGAEFVANTETSDDQLEPSVAVLANGNFVIAWRDESRNGNDNSIAAIKAQLFDGSGARIGGEFEANTTTLNIQYQPVVAALPTGGFVIGWTDRSGEGGDPDFGIKAQSFDSQGAKVGGEFLVNTQTLNDQAEPTIITLANGRVVVAWTDSSAMGGDNSSLAVKAQLSQGPAPIADNDAYRTEAGTPLTVGAADGVLVGDTDADGAPLTARLRTGPANGDLTLKADGSFVYTPTAGFSGTDSFTYVASDGSFDSAPATVTITVEAPPPPVQVQSGQTYDLAKDRNFSGTLSDYQGTTFVPSEELDYSTSNFIVAQFAIQAVRLGLLDHLKLKAGSIKVNIDADGDGVSDTVFTLADPAPNVTFLVAQDGDKAAITVQTIAQSTGGDDTITGTDRPDYIKGGDGDDVLSGGDGSDALVGGAGADTLSGGAGVDDLVGGDGVDAADYSLSPGAVLANLSASSALFNGGLIGAGTARDGHGTTDTLSGIENVTTGGGNDRVRGSDGANVIATGAGSDRIEGGAGDDTLDGGSGADALFGGTGNDTYLVDDAGDTVTENFDEGTSDEVRTSLLAYALGGADIERLTGVAAPGVGQQLTGNALANTITSGSGNDRLDGGIGIDTLIGGGGDDTYVITARLRSANSYFPEEDVVSETSDGGIDEVLFSVTNETGDANARFVLDKSYQLSAGVENLTLSATGFSSVRFTVFGNDLANVITGSTGNDFISGNGGADTLIGGDGDDYFVSADGLDTLRGGAGNDRYQLNQFGELIKEALNEGDADRIEIYGPFSSYVLPDNVEQLYVFNAASARVLTGNGSDNDIRIANVTGKPTNDFIDGGAGADRMSADEGNDVYVVDNSGDVVVERAGAGTDEVRTALSSYTLAAHVEKLTYTGTGVAALRANDGDNVVAGGDGDDIFYLQDGGDDTASGGGGNDGFYFGGALTGADKVDGGAGALDQIGLQGDYSGGVTIGGPNITGVEQLVLLPGSDTRFGDTEGNVYDYKITWSGGLAAGQRLVLTANTLRAGEDVSFDGSAEQNGFFLTYGGLGIDTITGGQKDDGFFFGADGRFGASDKVDGQGGVDQLGLQGDYTGDDRVIFADNQLVNIEQFVLLSGGDQRFGNDGEGYSYDITTSDGNVAAGATLVITANTLLADEFLDFDGRAETDGRFRVFGGQGTDVIIGGADDDEIFGGLSGDVLLGGDGGDVYLYTAVKESTGTGFDRIVGFDFRVDKIDLPVTVGNFSEFVEGAVNQASFDADIAALLNGKLGIGEAGAVEVTSGDMIGRFFGIVDANGVAGYQAGEDYVVEFVEPVVPPQPTIAFLI